MPLRPGIADSDLHYMLAECALRIDPSNTRAALSELDQAIQLNPKSVPARILRGETLLAVGRPQNAVVDLKIARELDPNPQRDTSNTTYLLGRAYAALGKRDSGESAFRATRSSIRLEQNRYPQPTRRPEDTSGVAPLTKPVSRSLLYSP